MFSIDQNTPNSTVKQRPGKKPLQPGWHERRILQCQNNLSYLDTLSQIWSKEDIDVLTEYYLKRLYYHKNQLETANSWLIEVSSPKSI